MMSDLLFKNHQLEKLKDDLHNAEEKINKLDSK